MLKGYAKPIAFSLLVGMLMLTGVYSFAAQQTGLVPIYAVLASGENQFYRVDVEAQLPTAQTVNYTITPQNASLYVPAGTIIKRFLPYINVTEPYIILDPQSIAVFFNMTYAINGVNSSEVFTYEPLSIFTGSNYLTLSANGTFNKTLAENQTYVIYFWAISYLG